MWGGGGGEGLLTGGFSLELRLNGPDSLPTKPYGEEF